MNDYISMVPQAIGNGTGNASSNQTTDATAGATPSNASLTA